MKPTWEKSDERRVSGRTNLIPRPGFLLEPKKNYRPELQGNLMQKLYLLGPSFDMEGHAKKCVERYCELAHKTTQQLHKVATPFIHDHQLKEEKNESVVELSTVCSQIVLKCLYFARIGRPDTLWSVNKLVRV